MDNPKQTIQDTIDDAYKTAYKAKDKKLYMALRFVLSRIKQEVIDTRKELTNEQILDILRSEVKKRKDAMKDFKTGGRDDLVEQNQYEIDIISVYLPAQMPDDELEKIVQATLAEIGATSPQDMGKAMGAVMAKVKGKADGTKVKEFVQKNLS